MWSTSGMGGYITLAVWGVSNHLERRTKPQVAHKWTVWLHNTCRLGRSPMLHSGGENQKWAKSGRGGYIFLAPLGQRLARTSPPRPLYISSRADQVCTPQERFGAEDTR